MRIVLVLLVVLSTSCKPGSAGAAAIDCTIGAAPALISTFGPALDQLANRAVGLDGKVDVASIKAATTSFVTTDAKCVAADLLARLLKSATSPATGPQSSPSVISPADVEAMRAAVLGTRRFHTPSGDI